MLAENLFYVVAIASYVFAAKPAASDIKTPVKNNDLFSSIKYSFVQLKSALNTTDAMSDIKALVNDTHIQGCAKFKKQDCIDWINSIKNDTKKITIVKGIVDIFKVAVKDDSSVAAVLKKVQKVQKKQPSKDKSKSSASTTKLGRRDEDITPIAVLLGVGMVGSVTVLLGLAALFITTMGSVIGVVPATAIAAIAAAIFDYKVHN